MKRIFFLIVFSVFLKGLGQNPYIRHYTTADGLPSNTVYQIFQDSKKFIWFTTDAGVVKFDGSTFVNYRKKDGLSSNDVVRIKEDSIGRIWLSNINGTLDFYYNNKIFNQNNTPFLRLLKSKDFFIDFYQGNDKVLYFYNRYGEVISLDSNCLIRKYNIGKLVKNSPVNWTSCLYMYIHHVNKMSNGDFVFWTSCGIFKFEQLSSSKEYIDESIGVFDVFSAADSVLYVNSTNYGLLQYRGPFIKKSVYMPCNYQKIKTIIEDKEGFLWFAAYDDGVICTKSDKVILKIALDKAMGLIQDHEGNIWVSTMNDGIYRINRSIINQNCSSFIKGTDSLNIKKITLDFDNKGFWMSSSSGLYLLLNDQIYRLNGNPENSIYDYIVPFKKDALIVGVRSNKLYLFEYLNIDSKKRIVSFVTKSVYPNNAKKIEINKFKNEMLTYDLSFLLRSNLDRPFSNIEKTYVGERINNAFYDSENNLIINATRNYVINDNQKKYYNKRLSKFDGTIITGHQVIDKSTEFFNIDGDSMYLMYKSKLYNLSSSFDPTIDDIIKNFYYLDSALYISTLKDIYICTNPFDIVYSKKLEVKSPDLTFDRINDFIPFDNAIYVAASRGLTIIPKRLLLETNSVPPIPFIKDITINDKNLKKTTDIISLVGRNKIKISFSIISLSSNRVVYTFMLLGSNEKWVVAKGTEGSITYQSLPKGEYTLVIKAKNPNSSWSKPLYLDIIIKPTFWQYPLFWVLVVLMLGVLTALTVLKIRSIRMRRIEANHQLVLMEQKALAAMMNPHFIFNSLGSIQNYLLRNKSGQAVTFLSQFSRLIRQNLKAVNVAMIELDQEISRIRNYLELEQLRLEGKFQYIIEVDPAIEDENYFVPSMMIQPFVENSIWHGISTIDIPGFIMLKVTIKSTRAVEVIIQDNGVGMAHTMLNRSKSKNNLHIGMEMTNRRLKLLSAKYKIDASIIVTSLSPHSQYPGTRITLTLPYTVEPKKDPVNKNTQ